jgi:alpha-D-ribose 1-methylphosphonate 5-triphosphate synthase subunit PhnH
MSFKTASAFYLGFAKERVKRHCHFKCHVALQLQAEQACYAMFSSSCLMPSLKTSFIYIMI